MDQPQQGSAIPQHARAWQQDAARLAATVGEAKAAVLENSIVVAKSIFFIFKFLC